MIVFSKIGKRSGYLLLGTFLAAMCLAGCAATIHHVYDPAADFSKIKNYGWEREKTYTNSYNTLIEKNVRYYADQSLQNKGYALTSDKPDVVVAMNYETEYSDPYKLRVLTIYIYRTQGQGKIWQGTADGTISADAASSELAAAVRKILANFPPR